MMNSAKQAKQKRCYHQCVDVVFESFGSDAAYFLTSLRSLVKDLVSFALMNLEAKPVPEHAAEFKQLYSGLLKLAALV